MVIPKYIKLKNILTEEIHSNKITPGKNIPSRITLMKKYNVARTTVDKAVNELIQDGILCGRQGSSTFVVHNEQKGTLKKDIFVVLRNCFVSRETILSPFLELLRQSIKGDTFLKFITDQDMAVNTERFIETAKAVIFCLMNQRYLELLSITQKRKCPYLLIDRKDADSDYITTDVFKGLTMSFEKLIKEKISNVGIVAEEFYLERAYFEERTSAFYRATALFGFKTKQNWHISVNLRNPDNGIKTLCNLLRSQDRPDVLFISGNLVSCVVSAFIASNIKVGQDIHLIHFDDEPETRNKKGVICLEQDFYTMGMKTLEWLRCLDREKKGKFQIEVEPHILEGR